MEEVVVATQGGNSRVGERESSPGYKTKRTPLDLHNPLESDPHNYSRVERAA